LIEILLRIGAEGRVFFQHNEDRSWNILDVALVLFSFVEVVLDAARNSKNTDINDARSFSNVRTLRIIRITRLLRILRMARVIRLIRALRILIHSIVSTLKTLMWALFLLLLIVYFFGVLITQATNGYLIDLGGGIDLQDNSVQLLTKCWGTVPRAMLTLFEAVTGGVDWDLAVRPLAKISFAWVLCFVGYISFTCFAVLNVMTGVFCQNAMESVQYDREMVIKQLIDSKQTYVHKTRDLFAAMFREIDSDASGNISMQEFEEHLSDKTVQAFFALLELDTSDAWTLFKLMDADGSGVLDANEFVRGCLQLKGPARSIDLAKLTREFKVLAQKISFDVPNQRSNR